MAQSSAPIVGVNLSDADWRDLGLGEAGVVGDFDGSAYALSMPTDSNVVRVGSSTQRSLAHVANFKHTIPDNDPEPVTVPVAVGSARTDIIALRYDPTFTGSPGPVRLVVISGTSSGLPSYDDSAPGTEDLPLWAITRQPDQSLAQATRRQLFSRLAPSLDLPVGAILPASSPLGTVLRQGSVIYQRSLDASKVPVWVQSQYVQPTEPTNAPDGALWFQHKAV